MSDQQEKVINLSKGARITLIVTAFLILLSLFLFQRFNFLGFIVSGISAGTKLHPYIYFIFNKTFRMIGNDLACMALILVFFRQQKYLTVAWYLFLIELVVVLPIYFLAKLGLEGSSELSSPLLSQFHRIIVNPILMVLLMVGFLYQRLKIRRNFY